VPVDLVDLIISSASHCCPTSPQRYRWSEGIKPGPKVNLEGTRNLLEACRQSSLVQNKILAQMPRIYGLFSYIRSRQFITTSAEVTANGGLVEESTQHDLNSGSGIIVICPD